MKKILKFCGLLVLLCCLKFSLYSQALASSVSLRSYPDSSGPVMQNENRSLKSILHHLEKKYNVSFFYKSEFVENRSINISDIKDSNLEQELKSCLSPNGLKYEKITDDFFVISPVKAEGISEIENKRSYQETKEEQQLSTSLSSIERLNSIYANIVSVRELQIKGKVKGEDGQGLPGVSVVVKGSTVGTVTDAEGTYSLTVPDGNAILVFSFIGYNTEEVPISNRTVIDLELTQDLVGLQEVVVTALGIKREEKTLGYSVAKVDGKSLTQARELNVAASLAGRIAGVSVSSAAGGPGSSSNVVIRGINSFSAKQPLYVINGIPMDNSPKGDAVGMWGGADFGDGISNINPDDIETMTVLKGSTASALYGSRAANGVILITTKSGKGTKGIGVDFNSNATIDQIMDFTDWQYEYGLGTQGIKPADADAAFNAGGSSWGGKIDNSMTPSYDGISRPYAAQENNMKNFYRMGTTFTNTIGLSGGNESGDFRLSVADMNNTSVIPNSGQNRITANLTLNYNLTKKLSIFGSTNITVDKARNRPNLSDSPGNSNFAVLFMPNTFDINLAKPGALPNGDELSYLPASSYITNPYFASSYFVNNNTRNRNISSLSAKYDFTDWLYIQARFGRDGYTDRRTVITPSGTAYNPGGAMAEAATVFEETNTDILVGLSKKLTDNIGLNLNAGANYRYSQGEVINSGGSSFAIRGLYNVSNTSAPTGSRQIMNRKKVPSVYYSAEFSFKDLLFLNTTGRQDWFSTLPEDNNGYFYPSVSASFVFSELMTSSVLSFGKFRAAWASTSGDADFAKDRLYYEISSNLGPSYPLGQYVGGIIPNINLKPYGLKEFELGLDLRFLKNRIGLDISYFNRKTTDEILDVPISLTSGFPSRTLNIGEMENKGVEFLLTLSPIKTESFAWNISWNHSVTRNKITKLAGGDEDELVMGQSRTQTAFVKHIVGLPAFQIMAFDYKRDDAGNILYGDNGIPAQGDLKAYGSGISPEYGGVTNEFSYKGLSFSFLIDYKFGGKIFSATNANATSFGLHKNTLVGREGGIVGAGVNETTGEPNTVNVPAYTYYPGFATNVSSQFVYDASFVKLRQVILGYNLPKSWYKSLPIQSMGLSFVARNLLILKKHTPNIDPESSYNISTNQGLELAGVPPVRSYGLNLNVKF